MTIKRIHFEGGIIFKPGKERIQNLQLRNISIARDVPKGEYDLTPARWSKYLMTHRLKVEADGSGIYGMINRDRNIKSLTEITCLRPKEMIVNLVEKPAVICGDPTHGGRRIRVHDIIFYEKGLSPER